MHISVSVVLCLLAFSKAFQIYDGELVKNYRNGQRTCPAGSVCVRPLQCPEMDRSAAIKYFARPPFLRHPEERRREGRRWQGCSINSEFSGICCSRNGSIEDDGPMVQLATVPALQMRANGEMLRAAEEIGWQRAEEIRRWMLVDSRSQGERFHLVNARDDVPAQMVLEGLRDVLTAQAFHRITNGSVPYGTTKFRLRQKRCLMGPPCQDTHARYRAFDGRCNNVSPKGTLWGSVGYPMERLLTPAYGDGVWSSRMLSITGRFLPSARTISSRLFPDLHHPHERHNVLLMQFGQFLVHDFSRNKVITASGGCCSRDGTSRSKKSPEACMPIPVSSKDGFYSQHHVRCLEFVRSAPAPMHDCNIGHARQMSSVTHFIDGSGIYGTSDEQCNELRAHEGGRLKSLFHRHFHNELPPVDHGSGVCEKWAELCFKTGDSRSNQIITLAAMHILFLREHNRVANVLAKLNSHWADQTVFQETRRIIIAMLQHIAFYEYLPHIVGSHYIDIYRLQPVQGHSDFYSPKVNPSVSSEFTVAAFRFGHSTVPSKLDLKEGSVETWRTFLDPTRFRERHFYDDLLSSMLHQPMQHVDKMVSASLTQFLDVKDQLPYGQDLLAINIQRGRDHAVRPYNDYLRLNGKATKGNFQEYGAHASTLAELYAHPEDVELYVGGLLEEPVRGGIVGPTFAELISDQFAKFRHGDRYFHSNGPETNPGHFTLPQLQAIQRVTMASLICANAGDPHDFMVQPSAFMLPSDHNVPVSCSQIPSLELSWWKD